ncbi:MAG: hypothetical protein COT74_11140 [Bdellovibrionales bacterium CG10_big_fil_rev_8_21_14_0_10_45_34]|nr:MAG: hypothetical protein COT74_11140 [Bdellovibrionales bacterium CG10_big_fil_rev_8_21_14_0_10_45_34]
MYKIRECLAKMEFQQIFKALKYAGWIAFGLYLFATTSAISRRAETFADLNTQSSDGVNSMAVLERTNWISSNGFISNGPLYYRLARTFLYFDPTYQMGFEKYSASKDRHEHFALMLVALLSVAGLSLLCSYIGSPPWARGWTSLFLMFCLLSSSELWLWTIFINHPDTLLTLLLSVGNALILYAFTLKSDFKNPLILAGATWGLALLSKTSALLFLSGALLAALSLAYEKGWRKQDFLNYARSFLLALVLTYLLVGFPQSLDLKLLYEFINFRAEKAGRVTAAWDIPYWSNLFLRTAIVPVSAVLGISLFQYPNLKRLSFSPTRALLATVAIPLAGFLSLLPMAYPDYRQHYILPVVGTLLVSSIFGVIFILQKVSKTPLGPRALVLLRTFAVSLIVFAALLSLRWQSQKAGPYLNVDYQLRNDAEKIRSFFTAERAKGKTFLFDPYVPIDLRIHPTLTEPTNFTKDLVSEVIDADYYISSYPYFKRFVFESPKGWQLAVMSEDRFFKSKEFYTPQINNEQTFEDGKYFKWDLAVDTQTGFKIWKRNLKIHFSSEQQRHDLSELIPSLKSSENVLVRKRFASLLNKSLKSTLNAEPRILKNVFSPSSIEDLQLINWSNADISLQSGAFSVWANIKDLSSPNNILLSVRSDYGTPRSLYLDRNGANGAFSFIFAGHYIDASKLKIITGKWHHYAISWSEGLQQLFVDGTLISEAKHVLPNNPARYIAFGHLGEGTQEGFWNGSFAELHWFNRSLNYDEVLALFKVGFE